MCCLCIAYRRIAVKNQLRTFDDPRPVPGIAENRLHAQKKAFA
jgi:hypothetical protein